MAKDSVTVGNVNHPAYQSRLNAQKYNPMRDAILQVLAAHEVGLTVAELEAAVLPLLPQDVFPGGETARWWLTSVKLDLEAKGVIERVAKSKPQRVRRTVASVDRERPPSP